METFRIVLAHDTIVFEHATQCTMETAIPIGQCINKASSLSVWMTIIIEEDLDYYHQNTWQQ